MGHKSNQRVQICKHISPAAARWLRGSNELKETIFHTLGVCAVVHLQRNAEQYINAPALKAFNSIVLCYLKTPAGECEC